MTVPLESSSSSADPCLPHSSDSLHFTSPVFFGSRLHNTLPGTNVTLTNVFDTEAVRRIYSVSCLFGLVTEFVECPIHQFSPALWRCFQQWAWAGLWVWQQWACQGSAFGNSHNDCDCCSVSAFFSQLLAFWFFLPRYVNICNPENCALLVVVAVEWRGRDEELVRLRLPEDSMVVCRLDFEPSSLNVNPSSTLEMEDTRPV